MRKLRRTVGRSIPAVASAVVVLTAVAACSSDSGQEVAGASSTRPAVTAAEFANQATPICVSGATAAAKVAPTAGMTQQQNAEALQALAQSTQATVTQLRALPLPEPAEPYRKWLDTVDQTADEVAKAGVALAAGDTGAVQQHASAASQLTDTAQSAARLLGLAACSFTTTTG
jgi:hypothetical protein